MKTVDGVRHLHLTENGRPWRRTAEAEAFVASRPEVASWCITWLMYEPTVLVDRPMTTG